MDSSPRWEKRRRIICVSDGRRPAFLTHYSPRNRRSGSTRLSRAFSTSGAISKELNRFHRLPVLLVSYALIKVKHSGGLSFLSASALEAVWQMTWVLVRQFRFWLCLKRAALLDRVYKKLRRAHEYFRRLSSAWTQEHDLRL